MKNPAAAVAAYNALWDARVDEDDPKMEVALYDAIKATEKVLVLSGVCFDQRGLAERAKRRQVAEIEQTCRYCPSQWEGKLADGSRFYARYRWGHLGVTVQPDENLSVFDGEVVHSERHGDDLDGIMDTETMLGHVGWVIA